MQDDQNGQKTIVLPSADKTRLTRFILSKKINSKQPCLGADGNTIMNLPWYPRKIVHFSLVLSPSRPKISMTLTEMSGLHLTIFSISKLPLYQPGGIRSHASEDATTRPLRQGHHLSIFLRYSKETDFVLRTKIK
jgi:hypothetical protein